MDVMTGLGLPPSPDTIDDENALPSFAQPTGVNPNALANVPTAYASGKAVPTGGALATAPADQTQADKKAKETQTQAMFRALQASAQGKPVSTMDAVLAGLTAQTGKASKNKAVALLDGLFTGWNAARQAKKNTGEATFDQRYKLMEASRQLDNDKATAADRSRRTSAYERSVDSYGRGGNSGGVNRELQDEKTITDLVGNSPWSKALARDDEETIASRKLTPEKRTELEAQRDAYEQRLRQMARGQAAEGGPAALPQGQKGVTSQPAPAPVAGPQAPTAPQRNPKTQATTKPLPQGVSPDDARAQTQRALDAARANGDKAGEAEILRRAGEWGLTVK